MFERYNEKARRTIFFARHEASQRSSAYIELEDLLLGALRADNALKRALASGAEEAERHGHKSITPGYLVIGVLLQEDSPAAMALERVGLGWNASAS